MIGLTEMTQPKSDEEFERVVAFGNAISDAIASTLIYEEDNAAFIIAELLGHYKTLYLRYASSDSLNHIIISGKVIDIADNIVRLMGYNPEMTRCRHNEYVLYIVNDKPWSLDHQPFFTDDISLRFY